MRVRLFEDFRDAIGVTLILRRFVLVVFVALHLSRMENFIVRCAGAAI